jgi:hypothetical protein
LRAREAAGRGIGIGGRRNQHRTLGLRPVGQRQHGGRATHRMADDGFEGTEAIRDAAQRPRKARHRAAARIAAAVSRLVERNHGVTGRAQRAHPRQETQRVTRPAMRQQHPRLRLQVAPLINGHAATVDIEIVSRRAAIIRTARTCAAGRERRAQQSRCTSGGGIGRKLAAKSIDGAQHRKR